MARHRPLFWQIYSPLFLITAVSMMIIAWFACVSFGLAYRHQAHRELRARAQMMANLVEGDILIGNLAPLYDLCHDISRNTNTRFTILLPSGQVVADSSDEMKSLDNLLDQPEIEAAIAGVEGYSLRYSSSLRHQMMFSAIPLRQEGRLIGLVRAGIPAAVVDQALKSIYLKTVLVALVATIVAALMRMLVFQRLSRPFNQIRAGAERLAQGDLSVRLPVPDLGDIGGLAESINQMAARLDDRIRGLVRQHNEQEAVLSSMVEGVLAVDMHEKIINMNQSAAQLLGVDASTARGRPIQEVIRNPDLQRFVARTLESGSPVEGEIVLRDQGERYMQAHGTFLHDEQKGGGGALVVMNDVTRLRRLEKVRRDFVANVSHELKTPVTSIKGFVETLLDGAMEKPEDARRFLQIIAKQADRLNAIIEDLLSLSRIEQETDRRELPLESASIYDVVKSAVEACTIKLDEKKLEVRIDGDPSIRARINPHLLEQAVINLVDNAIKYSEPGNCIDLGIAKGKTEISITVRDHGCGIEKEHLPRLFERFYRVDKARSRKLGGTGLGLAIVKHIVQSHGGQVTVDSVPGQGTTFLIRLPIALPA